MADTLNLNDFLNSTPYVEDQNILIDPQEETEEEKRIREEEEERLRLLEENERLRVVEEEQETYVKEEPVDQPSLSLDDFLNSTPQLETQPIETQSKPTQDSFSLESFLQDAPVKETRIPLTETGEVATFKREFAYGMAQEPTVAGSLYRLGKAKLKSLFSEKSYSEIAQDIEAERQQELRELFPEFAGKEETGAMLAGRMALALVDPVTFLIPWTKVAKLGKAGLTGIGAGVATADVALREEALYGEVSGTSLAAGALLGGGGTYLSSLISPFSKLADEVVEVVDESGKKIKKPVKIDGEPELNLNAKQTADLEDLGNTTAIQNSKVIANILDSNESAGLLYSTLNAQKANKFILDQELKQIQKIKKPNQSEQVRKLELEKLTKELDNNILKDTDKLEEVLLKQIPDNFAEIGYASLKAGFEKGIMTKDFATALMYETVRPLFGAMGGAAIGIVTADEETEMADVYRIAALGAFLGALQKKIQVTPFKIKKTNEGIVDQFLTTGQDIYRKDFFNTLKRMTAGTHASKLQAGVKAVQTFGARMFNMQGAGVKAGMTLGTSVESAKTQALNYWTAVALPEIIGDATEDTVLAAGRLVNNKNMSATSKHSFLQSGDLENVEAQALADKIINLTDEFKKYTKATGIDLKETDQYGLTQLIKTERIQSPDAFNDVTESFKLQFLDDVNNNKLIARAFVKDGQEIKVNVHIDDLEAFDDFVKVRGGITNMLQQQDVEKAATLKGIRKYQDSFIAQARKERQLTLQQLENPDIEIDFKEVSTFIGWAKNKANGYIQGSQEIRKKGLWDLDETKILNKEYESASMFKSADNASEDLIITAARHFENERVLYSQEARAYLANRGYFEDDPINTLQALFEQTVPVAEFARVFGAKGEGLQEVFDGIRREVGVTNTSNVSLQNIAKQQIKDVKDSVEAYFGLFQIDRAVTNNLGVSSIALMQAVLATTKLTKVAIPSFGDIIQTFKNSGVKAASSAYIKQFRNEQNASAALGLNAKRPKNMKVKDKYMDVVWNNRQYNGLLQREMKSWMVDINNSNGFQRGVMAYQQKFFELVQLGRITRFSRAFAFDAGATRAYDIGKKLQRGSKISQKLKKEMSDLTLTEAEFKYLGKFKNMDDMTGDKLAERYLNKAGFKSAERDALIPTVGNRRLFSQSRDPSIRFLGSFLSWAQAKSTQTNALISRVENGDAALALRMLAAIPVYGAIRELQLELNSSAEFKNDTLYPDAVTQGNIPEFANKLADAALFSGEFIPWYLDKVVNEVRYDYGSTPVSGLAPALTLMDDLATGLVVDPLTEEDGGKKGAIKVGETLVPFFKDFSRGYDWKDRWTDNYMEYDMDDDSPIFYNRDQNFQGGKVSDKHPVPHASVIPMERKDKMGNQSYDTQANAKSINPFTGKPYTDIYKK